MNDEDRFDFELHSERWWAEQEMLAEIRRERKVLEETEDEDERA